MTFGFLSPGAALVGLAVAAALLVLFLADRRSRRVATALGLEPPRRRAALPVAVAIALVGAIVALAAAQPVVSGVREKNARLDAEVIFVFDVTRSMLASQRPGAPNRFVRQRAAAKQLRAQLVEVPVGIASLTDRVLPHLFPSPSLNTFTATVDRVLGIERPPPDRARRGVATQFAALGALAQQNYFGEESKRRVAVVFSDGESLPLDAIALAGTLQRAGVVPVFVQFWSPDERVFRRGGTGIERYRPEPSADLRLREIATALGGSAFHEHSLDDALAAIRKAVGEGPAGPYGSELQTRTLSAWVLAFAFVPLVYVLWRRNV